VISQAATTGARRPNRQPAPQQRLRLLARRRGRRLPFLLLTGLVVVAGVLALAALTTAVNQQAFAVARLEQANRSAAARYSLLQAEVDGLRSPARVAGVARSRGLQPVHRARIVRWPGPTGDRSPTPAAASSLAAGGVRTDPAKTDGWVWTLDDPFPLKHYLAQP
jgi:hypothetical protein